MRELKFRAWEGWTKDSMSMLYSEKCNNLEHFFAYSERFENLMQFTGLKDINGFEIYEGDIMRMSDFLYEIIWTDELGVAGFDIKRLNGLENIFIPYVIFMQGFVIGNIYENPELT